MSHSDLPPLLDGGTALAAVGTRTVEDVKTHNRNEKDMRSSATSATHTSLSLVSSHATESLSEFVSLSLLFLDSYDEKKVGIQMLWL